MKSDQNSIQIKAFNSQMQEGVINLILPIQIAEFGLQITKEAQPDLLNIENFYQNGNGNFWCALLDGEVVGTIALKKIAPTQLALRKMFVKAEYRGKGLAKALLDEAFDWAKKEGFLEIYLGTTEQFLAAQKFYGKHGFNLIEKAELPPSFPIMAVDSKFYRKKV